MSTLCTPWPRLDVHEVRVLSTVEDALPQLLYDSNISMTFEQEGRAARRSLAVLREHVVGHDVVGHLQRGHQVHLKQAASLRTSSRKDVLHEDVGCAAWRRP